MLKWAIAIVACAMCGLVGALGGQAVTAARVVASPSDTGASLASLAPSSSAVAVQTVTATAGATRTTTVTHTAVATQTLVVLATDTPSPTTRTVTTTPRTAESAAPDVEQVSNATTYYANCADAKAAGAAPLRRGDPGYRAGLDRDGDGTACET